MFFPIGNPIIMGNGGFATQAISSSNTKVAGVFIAPKTGNIRYIGICCSAVSGSPAVDLRAETINATSGLPTGTLWGTNTNVNYSPVSTGAFVWTQMTADAAVTAGQLIAAVVAYVSGTSATVNFRFGLGINTGPYSCQATAGTYSFQNQPPCVCFKYDDGTIIEGGGCPNSTSQAIFNSGSNPNEHATVFTPAIACVCNGVAWYSGGMDASAGATVSIYSGTNTTPMTNGSITFSGNTAMNNVGIIRANFPASISLIANQTYRVAVKATSASPNITVGQMTFASNAERNATVGSGMTSDTRNGSSWIGESTLTTKFIVPLIDSLSGSVILIEDD
jgi:hypothetical protein